MLKIGYMCIPLLVIYFLCNRQDESRIKIFDRNHTETIKGIAIMLVILGHSAGEFGTRILNPFGSVGVALFLIVSGYGVYKSYEVKGLKYFWVKKFLHVVMPYIIIQSIFMYGGGDRAFSAKLIISDFLLIKPQHPYGWYLRYLFICYIIFWIIFSLKISNRVKGIMTLVICVIVSAYMGYLEQIAMFAFSLGVLFGIYGKESYKKKKLIFLMFISLLIGIISLGVKQLEVIRRGNQIIFISIEIIEIYMLSLFVIIFIYLFYKLFRGGKIINNMSYELYLVHGYTIIWLKSASYVNTTIFMGMTAIFAFAFHELNRWLEIKGSSLLMKNSKC